MSPEDARLVAALTMLRDQLAPVVDEIAFGELDTEDRRELARALRTVADALAPLVVIDGAMSERDRRQLSAMTARALGQQRQAGHFHAVRPRVLIAGSSIRSCLDSPARDRQGLRGAIDLDERLT